MAPTLTASRPPIRPEVRDIWKTHARMRTSQRETASIRLSGDKLQVSITSFQLRTSSPGLFARSTECVTAIRSSWIPTDLPGDEPGILPRSGQRIDESIQRASQAAAPAPDLGASVLAVSGQGPGDSWLAHDERPVKGRRANRSRGLDGRPRFFRGRCALPSKEAVRGTTGGNRCRGLVRRI